MAPMDPQNTALRPAAGHTAGARKIMRLIGSSFFALLLLTGNPTQAARLTNSLQYNPNTVLDIHQAIPLGQKAGRYDIAVLVGNAHYPRAGVPDVDYARNDVATMKRYLRRTMGYAEENILVELDATKGVFETLFGSKNSHSSKLSRFVRKGLSRVFIYYVGHGAPDIDTGNAFFVPVDSDPDYIANSGYSVATFYRNLAQLKAKQLVVILDTCFSGRTQKGLLFKNVSPALLRVKDTPFGINNGAVLTSAKNDQLATWYPAKQHSLFTYFFLKGLQGKADTNHDKIITLDEVNRYAYGEVQYMAGRIAGKTQTPFLVGKKDIVLARLQ